jgi:hypothetical protein
MTENEKKDYNDSDSKFSMKNKKIIKNIKKSKK